MATAHQCPDRLDSGRGNGRAHCPLHRSALSSGAAFVSRCAACANGTRHPRACGRQRGYDVGTRDATRRGIDLAYEIAGELAVNNVTVISGFAKGVDAAAHKGALAAGGRTLAVLGNGITVVFPAEHAELAEQIAASGALISEFRYDARPDRGRFPRRNRTMSGMSRAVLVVEAPLGSGALLTAKAAREQGRTVFVVRGDAAHANQQGLMALIDAGAQPISDAHDIIDALNTTHNHAPPLPVTGRSELQSKGARGAFAPIPEIKRDGDPDNSISPLLDETGILNILGDQALHVDDIAQRLGVSPSAVLAIMTRLEMNGHIQIVGHSQYRRHFSSRAN